MERAENVGSPDNVKLEEPLHVIDNCCVIGDREELAVVVIVASRLAVLVNEYVLNVTD